MDKAELKGKKLLILAGNDVHIKIVEAARELGVRTIVADYLPKEQSPAKMIADEYWNISTGDTEAIAQKCREAKVDGVMDFCIDTVQKHYQQICEKLGCPCYATKELFDIFTNKIKFKEFCKRYNVDVIPDYQESDIENGNVEYPVLIKPSDSRGSRGISVCQTKSETCNALSIAKAESKDGRAIIERYMYGKQDMSVVYMVVDGEPFIVKIGDRYQGKPEDHLQCQHMATILPSSNYDEYIKGVHPKVSAMIKGTGMKFGVVFLQGFWDNGKLYMYDPGLRFPGSEFNLVTKAATGFDSMKAFVEYAVTGNTSACYGSPALAWGFNGGTCFILSVSCRPGKIATFKGFDSIAKNPAVYSARQIYNCGDTVPDTHDVRQRVAEFIAYFPNKADIREFIKNVYDNLIILDSGNNDMIVSRVTNLKI